MEHLGRRASALCGAGSRADDQDSTSGDDLPPLPVCAGDCWERAGPGGLLQGLQERWHPRPHSIYSRGRPVLLPFGHSR